MTSHQVSEPTYAEARAVHSGVSRGSAVLFAVALLAGLALAPVAALLWVTLADPPTVPLASNGGLYLGEQALNQQAGVTLWFLVVGAAFGFVAGVLVCWWGRRRGWLTVVAVLVLCAVGALGSRYLGTHVFGPNVADEVAGARSGDPIQLGVQVDTWVAYLGWPIGGVLGALVAISFWSRTDEPVDQPPAATTSERPTAIS